MRQELLGAVRPVSSVDAAATSLRHAIASGQLKPGERIKEIPVATQLGLKRGAVRDALRVLAEEGLVRIETNQGATVTEVRGADLMELYALRLALGSLALRRLVHQPSDLDAPRGELAHLASAVRRRQPGKAVEADLAFQDALIGAAGLSRTTTLFARTTVQLKVYIGMVHVDFRPSLTAMLDEDTALFDLVEARSGRKALAAWHRKLHDWAREFVTHVDETFDAQEWLEVYGP